MENTIICQNCGSVDDYNIQQRGTHKTAYCNSCDRYIKHLSQGLPIKLYFGKYLGREVQSMVEPEEIEYLKWLLNGGIKQKNLREAVTNHLTDK